ISTARHSLFLRLATASTSFLPLPQLSRSSFYLGYEDAGEVHAEILKVILWVLLAAHVLGVLVHKFYWKTNVFRRMTLG
ncbi:cytochrome b, partial [Rhizobium ruizarguesonis]